MAPGEHLAATTSWSRVSEKFIADGGVVPNDIEFADGRVDSLSLQALRAVLTVSPLRAARWKGYGDSPDDRFGDWGRDTSYAVGSFAFDELADGDRLPDFAWDEHGDIAWGGRLYADSLVMALKPEQFVRVSNDNRLDTASVVVERDDFPPSAGD